MKLSISLFGPPTFLIDGEPVAFDTRKADALLAYLAVTRNVQTRDTLATFFWPELDQTRARAALRRTLSSIRKSIGPEPLKTTRETVVLADGYPVDLDVFQFNQLLKECENHGHSSKQVCSRCVQPLQQAVEGYTAAFMQGFTLRDSPAFDDWQFYEADRLQRDFASCLEKLVRCYEEQADLETALQYGRQWLALDPLHEPAHRKLMHLYARLGQRTSAMRQYRECVRVLNDELGVPPLDETTRLYQEILENRLAPDSPPPDPRVERAAPHPASATVQGYALIGRTEELSVLDQTFRAASEGGKFLVLNGEAGIGKTRLAEEFLKANHERAGSVLTARCYAGEHHLAYAPFIEAFRTALKQPGRMSRLSELPSHWLVEAARLLPEIATAYPDLPRPRIENDPGAQGRLFEGLRQLLSVFSNSNVPGILCLDDLQWADSATIDLLTYLVRRLDNLPFLIIGIWREEDLPEESELPGLSRETLRTGDGVQLLLERLSPLDVSHLAAEILDSPLEELNRLFDETEGLPFFVVEYLNAAQDASWEWSMPKSIQELQRERLGRVGDTERQLLTTAAVIGRSFDFDILREASGRSEEELITALENLIQTGLLVERASESGPGLSLPVYDFSHESLYQVVYAETSLARRRLLHRRVAETLINQARTSSAREAQAGQISQHFQLAGREAEAGRYARLAGDHARSLLANQEALLYYQTALALADEDKVPLHEAISDLQTLSGNYTRAAAGYETAAALASPAELPRLEHKMGNLHHRRGDYSLANSHFEAAFEGLDPAKNTALGARILADWSRSMVRLGEPAQAQERAQASLELADKAGDPLAISHARNILGMLARQSGDLKTAASWLESALQAAQGSLPAQIAARNNLALVFQEEGDLQSAIGHVAAALKLCERSGDRHVEAALLNHLADLLHADGKPDDAMHYLKQAVGIFAEIGQETEELLPEIWKLTEW
jgi:DNA-binding SARP family transcriptional activator